MIFKKKEKQKENKKPKVSSINPRKKLVLTLWVFLGLSFSFAIYKHFTAIDTHTVEERIYVEEQLIDTNSVENFVRNFAQVYYTWEADNEESLEERNSQLENYLTEDLHSLNSVMIPNDVPTSSSVQNVQIWSVTESEEDNQYNVIYSVSQRITEEEEDEQVIESFYEVTVYEDEEKNVVIIRNPTLTTSPTKSAYQPAPLENDNSLDSETREEIDEFLSTFFSLYPTASERELSYYVEDDVLPVINQEYVFSELINPVYIQEGEYVRVSVYVRYQDERTQADQLSQYELLLCQSDTWKIKE
ncbi:Conjugative transposon protein TcpC [Marinilactibacillus piezotolerans]|uniref:Conjugative transposon protein TcpC n=1 Tax=Marinilactibacillus piezotolerans TaxID=258723 RepID=A0A1I3X6E0_9LACT|nr:conjugal transfer protein [Marinilactibacillus piezotolerans]SFK14466.1 Conjugative transposon protein TcpC [Marinilactibacillus piezotolerans]